MKLYGIPNCDTVKKAKKYLDSVNAQYQFHDFKNNGVDVMLIKRFISLSSMTELVNKRSTTYRNLDNKEDITIATLVEYPTLIKRPVLDMGSEIIIGFSEEKYRQLLT